MKLINLMLVALSTSASTGYGMSFIKKSFVEPVSTAYYVGVLIGGALWKSQKQGATNCTNCSQESEIRCNNVDRLGFVPSYLLPEETKNKVVLFPAAMGRAVGSFLFAAFYIHVYSLLGAIAKPTSSDDANQAILRVASFAQGLVGVGVLNSAYAGIVNVVFWLERLSSTEN